MQVDAKQAASPTPALSGIQLSPCPIVPDFSPTAGSSRVLLVCDPHCYNLFAVLQRRSFSYVKMKTAYSNIPELKFSPND